MMAQGSCDFIACDTQTTIRVQVKSAYEMTRPSGANYVQATTRKGCGNNGYKSYTKDDCDVVAIVYGSELWLIPVEDLNGTQTITLAKGQDNRKARKGRTDWTAYKRR